MEKVTLKVKGMSCGHCVSSIEGSVGKLNGVQSVKVNLSSGEVDIEFDSSEVHLKDIKETIDEQGYDVE
ncbi:copper chaperone CopZ [Bacillus sp. AFS040349]|uniref:copper chaperone CopZ n=1 Tax=Bacillus sp. AFS040349 TaxID=2033502 RepID=UPI000BFD0ACA|nr:copper chaperone CopZ [Bacillus sp. AFS040349]PGT86454.1 copper resistance protein CopZ [Bacillus sp. AFS040349]